MSVPKPRKTLFETDLNDVDNVDIEGVGVLREDEKGNVYRYVKNLTPSAMAVGNWCAYPVTDFSASSVLAFTRVQLQMGIDFSGDTLAGVVVASGGLGVSASSCYGWILVDGFYSGCRYLAASATAAAIGDVMVPASASASTTLYLGSGTDINVSHYGILMKAIASPGTTSPSGQFPMRIKCL